LPPPHTRLTIRRSASNLPASTLKAVRMGVHPRALPRTACRTSRARCGFLRSRASSSPCWRARFRP